MDREQATNALDLLRRVVSQARDDTALQNWGAIWMFNGCTNGLGFYATHLLMHGNERSVLPYAGVWATILSVNMVAIYLLKGKSGGSKTFIEKQIWSIWTTFIVGMVLAAFVNHLSGLDRVFMPSVACLLAATAFSAMGAVMGRWWYVPCALWAAMALVLAALPQVQFAIFGAAWWATQFGGGLVLHLAKRRRLASAAPAPRLV